MNDRSYNQLDVASNVLTGQRDDPAHVAFEKYAKGDMDFRIEFPLNDLFPMSADAKLNQGFEAARDNLAKNQLSEALAGFRAYRAAHPQHLRALNLEAITYSRIHGDGPVVLNLLQEGLAIAARNLAGTEEPEGYVEAPTAEAVRLQQAQIYINVGACYHDLAQRGPDSVSMMADAMNAFAAGYAVLESCLEEGQPNRDTLPRVCAYSAIRVADAALRSGRKVALRRYLQLAVSHDQTFTETFIADRSYLEQLHSYYLLDYKTSL